MNITAYALSNRALIKFILAILLFGGIYAFDRMSKMEDPEITVMQAMVVATYPGASPYEIELEIADPIEKAILTMPSLKRVETRAMDNYCLLSVELESTTKQSDIQQQWDLLRRKMSDITSSLPKGAAPPVVMDNFGDVYGMFFAITFDGYDTNETMDYISMIERRLKEIEGIGQITLYGNQTPSVEVVLDQARLASLGILPFEILSAIENNNSTIYAGLLDSGDSRYKIDIRGKFASIDDIGNTIIKGHEGETFRLSDIATIRKSVVTP